MRIYTKTGDDGTTGLLYGGRLGKDDLRVEAYGTSDEAVSALGIARAHCRDASLAADILRLQRELFTVGAELATAPENRIKLESKGMTVSTAMVEALETMIDSYVERTTMPAEFVIPGESPCSAGLDLARSYVRRCERRCVELARGTAVGVDLLHYLNRLADLLFVMARYEEAGFTPLHVQE